jgi:uncharacterized membrane protein
MVAVDYQIISKPNCSTTSQGRIKLFLLLAVVPALVGIGFSLAGMWPVFPFVGLELLALACAFYYIDCHASDYESITIDDDLLVVEKRSYKHTSRFELNPYWAQVALNGTPNGDLHLYLRSHGKQVEIGSYMNNKQRVALAEQLQKRTGAIYGHRT